MSKRLRRTNIKCPTKSCAKSFGHTTEPTFFSDIVIEELVQNASKTRNIPFKQLFCALLNMQGVHLVIFHVKNVRIVDTYDSKQNDAFKSLIPGACAYHDRYERLDIDANHFGVRVKPSVDKEPCILSTLDFHTYLSQDRGLDTKPTHSYMQKLLKSETHNADMVHTLPKRDDFILDKEVRIDGIPFTENVYRQAKGTINNTNGTVPQNWKDQLKGYISAFSKVPGGGTVYFGVNEEKVTPSSELKSFICKGVHLNEEQKERWRTFCNETVQEMLWVARSKTTSTSAIEVEFIRPKHGQQDCYVIIVTVKQFRGVGFLRKDGPESYELDPNDKPIEVKPWTEWARLSHCGDLVDVSALCCPSVGV